MHVALIVLCGGSTINAQGGAAHSLSEICNDHIEVALFSTKLF